MTPLRLHTVIEMTERALWHSTHAAPTVTATVVSSRKNAVGGVSYGLEFVATKKMNGKPVLVTRFLDDTELSKRLIKVIKKVRQPRAIKRTGRAA